MFSEKGYVPIVELYSWFLGSISFWEDSTSSEYKEFGWAHFESEAKRETWDSLRASPGLFASTSQFGTVEVSKYALITSSGWSDFRNAHFDIRVGTLGSGHGNLDGMDVDEVIEISEHTAKIRYGPLAFCPLVIPEKFWLKYSDESEVSLREKTGYPKLNKRVKSYSEQIIAAFKDGTARTREDYKARLAPNMKFEEWRAHWREAVTINPELSKPGPKK